MKVGFLGYGKLAKVIAKHVINEGNDVVFKINSKNAHTLTDELIRKADLIFEFSNPDLAFSNIEICLKNKIPCVCGTTAWLDKWLDIVAVCNKYQGTLFYASNFSLGANLFFNLNNYLAKIMKNFDEYKPSITEIHHLEKKDAPSGTAISLAKSIVNNSEFENWELKIKGDESRGNGLIPILSIREENVPGTHIVEYQNNIDNITISHKAYNREGFAKGAVAAAKLVINKQGVLGMQDLLGAII